MVATQLVAQTLAGSDLQLGTGIQQLEALKIDGRGS